MKTIILDTNFLMIPYKYHIDIFSEIERLVPETHKIATLSSVVKELDSIVNRSGGSERIAARIALKLIEKKGVGIIECKGKVDSSIINFALNNKYAVVCTNDKELKEKLKESGISIIFMRGKSRLEFVNCDL